jgi:hypothetical protein
VSSQYLAILEPLPPAANTEPGPPNPNAFHPWGPPDPLPRKNPMMQKHVVSITVHRAKVKISQDTTHTTKVLPWDLLKLRVRRDP